MDAGTADQTSESSTTSGVKTTEAKTLKKSNRKPSPRQKKVFKHMVEKGGTVAEAMREADYSEATIHNPQKVTESQGFISLLESLPDELLSSTHLGLLKATKIEHMIFPLGPRGEDDENFSGGKPNAEIDEDADPEAQLTEEIKERTSLTDGEIIDMLAEVGCTVKRIVHGTSARHVYFWVQDGQVRDKALDKAYKIKGTYAPEKSVHLSLSATVSDEERNHLESIAQDSMEKLDA